MSDLRKDVAEALGKSGNSAGAKKGWLARHNGNFLASQEMRRVSSLANTRGVIAHKKGDSVARDGHYGVRDSIREAANRLDRGDHQDAEEMIDQLPGEYQDRIKEGIAGLGKLGVSGPVEDLLIQSRRAAEAKKSGTSAGATKGWLARHSGHPASAEEFRREARRATIRSNEAHRAGNSNESRRHSKAMFSLKEAAQLLESGNHEEAENVVSGLPQDYQDRMKANLGMLNDVGGSSRYKPAR